MDLAYLRKLIKILDQSNVTEMEIDEEGIKVRLVKTANNRAEAPPGLWMPYQMMAPPTHAHQPAAGPDTAGHAAGMNEEKPTGAAETVYHEVKSPIVGTFYRAPAPDADSYVEVGQEVEAGTVLCIVEAMKLMNEIESDVKGKIVKIMVENAQPIEYNQTLFLIEPTK
jgi:acetyl-CoA carboxylase biotin carboxyl carrier protein